MIAEAGLSILVDLRWRLAVKTLCGEDEDDFDDDHPGYELVGDEFLRLGGMAHTEVSFAKKLDRYLYSCTYLCFNPVYNDTELYTFVGSLYLARLFHNDDNRRAFLAAAHDSVDFTDEQLLSLVRDCSLDAATSKKIGRMSNLVSKILSCHYFTHAPRKYTIENEHLSPLLEFVRKRQAALRSMTDPETAHHVKGLLEHFESLEAEITTLYKLTYLGPVRHASPSERCSDGQAFTLSTQDAKRLLAASRSNSVFFDLISSMPPNCKHISHEQALVECAEHARLWLFDSTLPLYYNFGLRYCDIAVKGAPPSQPEWEAWRSPAGFHCMLPSAEEKRCRRLTLSTYWDGAAENATLQPEKGIEAADLPEKLESFKQFLTKQAAIKPADDIKQPESDPKRALIGNTSKKSSRKKCKTNPTAVRPRERELINTDGLHSACLSCT